MTKRQEELRKRRERALAGGGPERVKRQKSQGKGTARERLSALFDPGTFVETGMFVEHRSVDFGLENNRIPGDAVVTGFGSIGGRLAYAFSQDFTVLGGSLGEMHAQKIVRILDLALQNGAPVIGLFDSGGARIQEGVDALHGFGEIFRRNVMASGVIPQISVILGPCAGGAAYSPALTDLVIMAEGTGQMFITGPQVIKAVTGEEVSIEDLGGAMAHARKSGVAHHRLEREEEVGPFLRSLLSYLPQNTMEDPPVAEPIPPSRSAFTLPEDMSRPYEVREVIEALVDGGSFLELHRDWAPNLVVGLGRLEGQAVAMVANQPRVLAGCLDIHASDKLARFVRFADTFNLPVITLVDTPGYLPGVEQEHGGIIRHGAKVLYAYAEATVPKVTVILRKAYGGAYLAMGARSLGADLSYALPGVELAVMGPEGAANIIFREEIAKSPDPARERQRRLTAYREQFANPYVAAARGYLDGVIFPEEVRAVLLRSLWSLRQKRAERPAKKHGNMPL